MAPSCRLLTLGSPLLLSAAGEPVRLRTRKHFALLIRLAVEPGTRLTRDYLMDLLWGDAPAERARHSLAQALTVLREVVGRERVLIQRAAVTLPAGVVDADVLHLDASDRPIRGPFLDGFEVPGAAGFEHWKDAWRARLGPRLRDCLVRQMDAGRRIGDFAAVERHAQVLHDLDPLSEDAVRGLMEARAWVGDRSNALAVYRRFAARLAAELGAQPSAELTRVVGLLRAGRRAPPRPGAAEAGAGAAGQVAERQERRFEAEPLIGREREFAALYDAWLEARAGTPRIVVLTGDPGVGKTTLANAFVSTCQMEGAVVARAQAYDAERELPFAVLAELVRQLTLQRAIGATDPEALSELARVTPEICRVFPGVPKPHDWAAEVIPLRLADGLLKAVEAATEESPLVLVVDDIHAADNASAAILHLVARKLPPVRLLLILTGRSAELRAAGAPGALVADPTVQALRPLLLDVLAPEAAARLVTAAAARAGGRLSELPTARLLQAGNGNPLALELLTREWVAHGAGSLLSDLEALNTQPAATIGIPRAIAAVFERQLRRLDAPTRAALDLAAVLGRRLADLPLYEVVGLSPATAGEALSRLREEGFLREIHGGLEFRNELLRAQAYYAIAGPARRHLHRGVGEMFVARAEPGCQTSRVEAAWHFLRGDNDSQAMRHGVAAAEEALRVGAPYEAEGILRALLRKPALDQSRADIEVLLAKALLGQSNAEGALSVLNPLIHSKTALSVRDGAEVARMRATAIYLANRDAGDGLLEAADTALTAARASHEVELLARALFEYARSGAEVGDEERVRNAMTGIEDLLHQPDGERLPILHCAEGFCHFFFFEPRAALASLEKARNLLTDRSDVIDASFIHNGWGNCKACLCEFESAQESYLSALELALKSGDDSRASIISANISSLATNLGDYHGGVKFGEQSVLLGTRARSQPNMVAAFSNLADAYFLLGMTAKALQCLERAQDWFAATRSWAANLDLLCNKACVALLMGNVDLALNLIGSVEKVARGRERSVPNPGTFAKLTIFRAAHVSGPEVARRLATQARATFRGRNPFYDLFALVATAWLERYTTGCYSEETTGDLRALQTRGLSGFWALQAAQGFLR